MTALILILGALASFSSQAVARTDELFGGLDWFTPQPRRARHGNTASLMKFHEAFHGIDGITRRSLQACSNDHYYCEGGLVHKATACDDSCDSCAGSVTTEDIDPDLLFAKAQWNCSLSRSSVACVDDDTIEFYDCATGEVLVEADVDGTVDDSGYCVDSCSGSLETLEGDLCIHERFFCDNSTGTWTAVAETACGKDNCTADVEECQLQYDPHVMYPEQFGCSTAPIELACNENGMFLFECANEVVLPGAVAPPSREGVCFAECFVDDSCHNHIFCDGGDMKISYSCDPTCGDCLGETINASESLFLEILGSNCEYSTNNATCDGDVLILTNCSTGEPIEYPGSSYTDTNSYCVNSCEVDLDDGEKFDCSAGGATCSADDEVLLVTMCPPGACEAYGGIGGDCKFGPVPYNNYRDSVRADLCEDPFRPNPIATLVCVNGTVFEKSCITGELIQRDTTADYCNDHTTNGPNPKERCSGLPCQEEVDCGRDFTCECPDATAARRNLLFGYTEPDACACVASES